MKKFVVALIVVAGLSLCVISFQKIYAVNYSSGGSCTAADYTFFPYHFLCGSDNNDTINTFIGAATSESDISLAQDIDNTRGAPGQPPIEIAPRDSLDIELGFDADGNPMTSQNGSSVPVLVWAYVLPDSGTADVLSSGYSPSSITNPSNGGSTGYCPGTGGSGAGKIYNYNGPDPDKSPAAYNVSSGYEDCGQHGLMAYWKDVTGIGSGTNWKRHFKFTIQLDRTKTDKPFCVRENVSVNYSPNTGYFSGSTSPGTGTQPIASHIAKQSKIRCYTMVNRTPVGSLRLFCDQKFTINGASDPDGPAGPIQYRIVRVTGGSYIVPGFGVTDAAGNVTTTTASGLAATSGTTYKLQVLDQQTLQYEDTGSQNTSKGACPVGGGGTPPNMIARGDCSIINLQVGDNDNDGTFHGSVGVHYRNADGSPGAEAGAFNYEVYAGTGAGGPSDDVNGAVQLRYDNLVTPNANNGWIIYVYLNDELPNGDEAAQPNVRQDIWVDGPCYQATCSLSVVSTGPTWPANGVIKGQDFRVTGTITDRRGSATVNASTFTQPGNVRTPDSPYPANVAPLPGSIGGVSLGLSNEQDAWTAPGSAPSPTVNEGSTGVHYFGPGSQTFNVTAHNVVEATQLNYFPDYYFGFGRVGGPCSTPVNTYTNFTLDPRAQTIKPSAQNPTTVTYKSWVNYKSPGQVGGRDVKSPMTSRFYMTPASGPATCSPANRANPSAVWTWNDTGTANDVLNGICTPTSINAGDEYCTEIHLDWTLGYVGPGGSSDLADTRNPATIPDCFTVYNEPYVHILGSDASAGGGFEGGSCTTTPPGGINTFLSTVGTQPVGSGAQFGAISIGPINGFSSANLRTTSPTGSKGLSFANDTSVPGVPPAPPLGGDLGGTHCAPDYYAKKPNLTDLPLTSMGSPTINANTSNGGSTATVNDAQYYNPPGVSPLKINGGTLDDNTNLTIYVDGDVRISNNIMYGNTNWGTLEKIPSFRLIVKGNIYVEAGVTQLDGLYVAQPDIAGARGSIYTCASNASVGLTSSDDLLTKCNKQLVVNGAFVAQKVFLSRSFGSLRDSYPGEHLTASTPRTCAAAASGSPTNLGDCAAEIFNFSPELYFAQPSANTDSGPTTGKYDYITSLAPVL